MFAKVGGVCLAWRNDAMHVISVSCFEVGFCESNVCFRGVVPSCDGGLIID